MSESNQPSNDHQLTYKEVSKLLNRSKRTIQEYVNAGKLNPKSIQGPRGMQKYFSEAEVRAFNNSLKSESSNVGSSPPGTSTTESKPTSDNSGVMMIREQQQQIQTLSYEKGQLEAQNAESVKRIARFEKREEEYKQRIADLEPKVEALTQALHSKEKSELQENNESLQRSNKKWGRTAIVAVASTIVLLLVLAAIVLRVSGVSI